MEDLVADVEQLLNREIIDDLPTRPAPLVDRRTPLAFGGPNRRWPIYRLHVTERAVPYEIDIEAGEDPWAP